MYHFSAFIFPYWVTMDSQSVANTFPSSCEYVRAGWNTGKCKVLESRALSPCPALPLTHYLCDSGPVLKPSEFSSLSHKVRCWVPGLPHRILVSNQWNTKMLCKNCKEQLKGLLLFFGKLFLIVLGCAVSFSDCGKAALSLCPVLSSHHRSGGLARMQRLKMD